MMFKHLLPGCHPKPLSSYLKALGILRIIAEQRDSQVKGCWEGEIFSIITSLDKSTLETFFCEKYSPTPIVAPWNGGSGFYPGDKLEGIEAILSSDQGRFTEYRKVISQIKEWPEISSVNTLSEVKQTLSYAVAQTKPGKEKNKLEGLLREIDNNIPSPEILEKQDLAQITLAEIEKLSKENTEKRDLWRNWWNILKKARTKCNEINRSLNKGLMLPLCRIRLPESTLQWLDAVYALRPDEKRFYNPIFGTGGNDGKLELSNNFMQRVAELFISGDSERAKSLFNSSAYGMVLPGLTEAKIGQYDPGRAGGFNQGMGIKNKDFKINPWDFILAIEGALVFAGAICRRNSIAGLSQFAAPFTVEFSPVGFSSSAYKEKGRYETWLPLWHNPASYAEVRYLFSEGRSVIGRKMARTGIEFSRAVGTLGVDRGIESFERYAFLKRRGKSYVALPVSRIPVFYKPGVELLDELDVPMFQFRRFLREFNAIPDTFQRVKQGIDEAIFNYCLKPEPYAFSQLVRAIGNMEKLIAMRDRSKLPQLERPLYGLSPRWIEQSDDGSIEVRIAGSLSSIQATGKVGPIRSNMAGVNPSDPRNWSDGNQKSCWAGSSLAERLGTVLLRRLLEAEQTSAPRVPIKGRLQVSPEDVMLFLLGECDENKIEELLWGFTLIDWRKPGLEPIRSRWEKPVVDEPLSRSWCLLKLLHSPDKIRDIEIKRETRVANLLLSGHFQDACNVAIHRLFVSGLNPYQVGYVENLNPILILASLLIPIKDQWKLENLVLKPTNFK